MKILDRCKWVVASKIDGKNYDDKKSKISITAVFDYLHLAEDFIKKCLPEETRGRFFIIDFDKLKVCEDYDKIQRVNELYATVL